VKDEAERGARGALVLYSVMPDPEYCVCSKRMFLVIY